MIMPGVSNVGSIINFASKMCRSKSAKVSEDLVSLSRESGVGITTVSYEGGEHASHGKGESLLETKVARMLK